MHQPKYPVEDGTPWGVSHTRADMQKVRDAAAAYEPPAAVRSLPVLSSAIICRRQSGLTMKRLLQLHAC